MGWGTPIRGQGFVFRIRAWAEVLTLFLEQTICQRCQSQATGTFTSGKQYLTPFIYKQNQMVLLFFLKPFSFEMYNPAFS